ncbi:hypothetical protein VTH06DRAFT_6430 [Thermothelomyces fergusii]
MQPDLSALIPLRVCSKCRGKLSEHPQNLSISVSDGRNQTVISTFLTLQFTSASNIVWHTLTSPIQTAVFHPSFEPR